jgi:adenosylhomocysteine nucleosidase
MTTAHPSRTSTVGNAPFAVFVATQAEMKPIATALPSIRHSANRSNSVVRIEMEGRDLLLTRTGVGPNHAEVVAHRLFEEMPIAAALSLGVAGGLSPLVLTGDLIVGDRVILQHNSGQTSFPCNSGLQETALTALKRLGNRHWLGPILTVDHILTMEEKRILAAGSEALAVDMESAAIASAASACSIPFLAIRGILDPVHEDLAVGFDQFLDAEGEPHLPRLTRYLLMHPFTLPYLVGLGRRTKAVCTRLGLLLQELSTTLS